MSKDINRLEERRAIAAEMDAAEKRRSNVNSIPEVMAARKKADAARKEADKANNEFREVFNKHYPRDDQIRKKLAKKHPGLFLLGGDDDGESRWIARCAVTRLPLFKDDITSGTVWIGGIGEEDYEKTFVLKGAVQVDEALCIPHAEQISIAPHKKEDAA